MDDALPVRGPERVAELFEEESRLVHREDALLLQAGREVLALGRLHHDVGDVLLGVDPDATTSTA